MGCVAGVDLEVGGRDALLPAQYHCQDRLIAQVILSVLCIHPCLYAGPHMQYHTMTLQLCVHGTDLSLTFGHANHVQALLLMY